MTEPEYLACSSPPKMQSFLADRGFVSERKLRLFAVASCRRIWNLLPEKSHSAIEVSERFADGQATVRELWVGLGEAVEWVMEAASGPDAAMLDLLSAKAAIFCCSDNAGTIQGAHATSAYTAHAGAGSPTHGVLDVDDYEAAERLIDTEYTEQARLVRDIFPNPFRPLIFNPLWRTETVQLLSRSMYESRDFSAMKILSDALLDAGCNEPGVIEHCRSEGPHVRGCFLVDLCLGLA